MVPIIAIVSALFFFIMGAAALRSPEFIMKFFDTYDLTPSLQNEIRAVYGGFGIAVAGLILFALIGGNAQLSRGILFTLAFCVFGMAVGRLVSFLINRNTNIYPYLFVAIEFICAFAFCYWMMQLI